MEQVARWLEGKEIGADEKRRDVRDIFKGTGKFLVTRWIVALPAAAA